MRFISSLLLLFVITSGAAFGDQSIAPNFSAGSQLTATGITVSATGVKPYDPDIAVFTITVARAGNNAQAAQAAQQTAWQRLADLLKKAGVPSDAIELDQLTFQSKSTAVQAINGAWQVTQALTTRVPTNRAGALADALDSAGFQNAFSITFDTSKRDELYQAALHDAIEKADRTAATIAASAHVEIVRVEAIDAGPSPELMHAYQGMLTKLSAGPMGIFSGFGSAPNYVTATVLANYRIK